ncbi:MAG: Zn-dependent metalloprotease [Planctomycetota bacterium]|jgi:Zn-dependent metalloprotease
MCHRASCPPSQKPNTGNSQIPMKDRQLRFNLATMLCGTLLSPGLLAQDVASPKEALDEFRAEHPRARIYGSQFQEHAGDSDEMGTSSMIYGTTLAVGSTPVDSAWNHIEEVRGMLGAEIGDLQPELRADGSVMLDVMFDRTTQSYKFSTFRFQQVKDGVPVFRSGVGFMVRNEPGNPLVMSTLDVKDLTGLDSTVANFAGSQQISNGMYLSTRRMLQGELSSRGLDLPAELPPIEASENELVVWAGTNNEVAAPVMAMKFIATRGSEITDARFFQRHLIVASVETGEILLSENMVQNFTDVTGTVSGRATSGFNSLECDPEVAVPLPYVEASIVGGNSTFTDVNGQFVISHGGSSQVTVNSRLRGEFFEVFDDTAGGAIPQISTTTTPPGPVNLLHNPTANQEFKTAGVNAYLEANVVRDYVLGYVPNYPTIGTQNNFDIVVNEDNFSGITSCNAVYTGSSMVFWRNTGCNNTAFSDVVYHEYGHHLINVTGNGQGQMGEGSGDCMGVLIQDDPILGQGFSTCGQGIRNANNNKQYPCVGGIHDCGTLISGCIWDLREELIVTEPLDYRDLGAELFLNMLVVRGQMLPGNGTIDPQITIIYLTLDDDDGDIGNGTPHYVEIADAFGSHNMDAPPLQLLEFTFPNGRPDNVQAAGGQVEFTVDVTSLLGTPMSGTGTLHVNRGNGFETYAMTETSPNLYGAIFPASDCASVMTYYVSAQTSTGLIQTSPTTAPETTYSAVAASTLSSTFSDNFESNLGWTVSGNATDGEWDRGTPAGGGDRGDPPVDADGSGQCYLTDNVDGNSDVDGGSTTVTSPTMMADDGGNGVALLTYHRWFSNTFGGDPENDIFLVEISNDNGATWSILETVGPGGPQVNGGWREQSFVISDFLAPTNSMRVRFTASDTGTGSVVEAGVDGVRIDIVSCETDCNDNGVDDAIDISAGISNDTDGNSVPDECGGLVTSYCQTAGNSIDPGGALMSSLGSIVISDNAMTLNATPVPNTFGLFFFGPQQTNNPFGQGFLCVSNPIVRLAPGASSGFLASRTLDFTGSGGENQISAGDTMNFQFWYRDPATGSPLGEFNLSDGLEVTFPLE